MIKKGTITKIPIFEIYSYFYEINYCYHGLYDEHHRPFMNRQNEFENGEFTYTDIFV